MKFHDKALLSLQYNGTIKSQHGHRQVFTDGLVHDIAMLNYGTFHVQLPGQGPQSGGQTQHSLSCCRDSLSSALPERSRKKTQHQL